MIIWVCSHQELSVLNVGEQDLMEVAQKESNLKPRSHQEPSMLNVGEQDLMEVAQKESNLEPHSRQEPSVLNVCNKTQRKLNNSTIQALMIRIIL